MKFQTLKNTQDLEHFSRLTENYINVRLPVSYLEKSKVVVCKNNKNEICGGFVLVLQGPFRVINSIPSFDTDNWKEELSSCAEITGLWLDNNFVKKTTSLRFWLKLYFEMIKSNKKYFTYAWGLKKPKLGELYHCVNPKILFQGETKIQPGMKCPDAESVEIVKRANIIFAPFFSPKFVLKRLAGKRSKKGHNQHRSQLVHQLDYS